MAAEAVADVAHGGVFLCVCVSVTVVQKLWFFTHGCTKVVQTYHSSLRLDLNSCSTRLHSIALLDATQPTTPKDMLLGVG